MESVSNVMWPATREAIAKPASTAQQSRTSAFAAIAFATAALMTAIAVSPTPAMAQQDDDGYVVAVSRHGNGSVSGPVRPARYGYEVRLPGGTWVDCRRSCSETLRVQTVDIFENQDQLGGYGTLHNECGLFIGCRNLLRGIR